MKTRLLKKMIVGFIALFSLTVMPTAAKAQSTEEIINLSYFISFGRYANSGEMNYWRQNLGGRNIAQMVTNHRSYLKSNQYEREQSVKRAYMDAFGWQPSADELRYWSGQNKTYAEMMKNHVDNWLNVYPDKKQHVIRQSYYKVFQRNANNDEVRYWMQQRTIPFIELVALHTTWKKQNQRSSKMGSILPNLNTNDVSTAKISNGAMAQVVAAGSANVVSAGGGNVVAAGSANVIAPGGGN